MPATHVVFYKDVNGTVPVLNWLDDLQQSDRKGWAQCVARIERLVELGHELRRPEADILRDGIHELRAKHAHVQYRILYFFHGRNAAVLAHAIRKQGAPVPPIEILRAVKRKIDFQRHPAAHTYEQGAMP